MAEDDESRSLLLPTGSINGSVDLINGQVYHSTPSLSNHEASASVISPDNKEQYDFQVYKRRWYILTMFGIYAFSQCLVWNTWGPISTSSEDAFGWSDATVTWLTNWGPVSYILVGLFLPWLLQVKGLRWAIVSSMFLVAVGASFRVITSDPSTATILIHIGQFLNGLAGPIGMCAFPTLSATWFPPHERVTATAIGTSISAMGSALAFILGPAFVYTQPPKKEANSSVINSTSPEPSYTTEQPNTTAQPNATEIKAKEVDEIMMYMYCQCGWSILVFLIVLVYFPAKPPKPPCVSATVERDKYWPGLWSLRKKGYFLIVGATYGVSLGVLNCWITVLNINLQNHITEETAGWIGFYATVGACAASLIIGRFADLFSHFIKLFILVMYILGTVFLVAFALLLIDVIPYSEAYVYITVITSYVLVNAAVPMMYELACELAYPTSEGAANGLLTYFNNFWGFVFLAVFLLPDVGTMWMNWVAVGATAICIPLIAVLKGRFNRLEVDKGLVQTMEQEIVVKDAHGIQ